MNTIGKILSASLVGLMATGCVNLDLNPLSEGSSENWYKDATEIEMSLNNLYNTDFFPIDDVSWDDDWMNRNSGNVITLGQMTSQWWDASNRWANLYKAVSRSLKIVDALEGGSASDMSEDIVKQYEGEAYFVLGSAYCMLASYYGDCVLNKDGMELAQAYTASRTPKKEVLAFAYECLDKAAEYLPKSHSGQQRPTCGAALGMKARYALFNEDWQIAADAAQKCMDLGVYSLHENYRDLFRANSSPELMFYFKGDLTQRVGIGMFSNVKNLVIRKIGGFSNQGPSLELFCSYTCTDGLPIDESPLFEPRDPFRNRDPRMAYSIQPFKTKYSPDYEEYEQSKLDGTFPSKYPDYITLGYEYNPSPYANRVYEVSTGQMVVNNDSKASNQHSVYTGLQLRKFVKDEWASYASFNNVADNCYPYLRYAEVLLTYAEAKNELGSITQADLDKSINLVRQRAYAGTGIEYPKITVASQSALRKTIRMERRVELAFEGHRYRDLLRWKIADYVYSGSKYYLPRTWSGSVEWNGSVENSNVALTDEFKTMLKNWDAGNFPLGGIPSIDENGIPDIAYMEDLGYIATFYKMSFNNPTHYLWPIPADDILVNSNLTQNPGY